MHIQIWWEKRRTGRWNRSENRMVIADRGQDEKGQMRLNRKKAADKLHFQSAHRSQIVDFLVCFFPSCKIYTISFYLCDSFLVQDERKAANKICGVVPTKILNASIEPKYLYSQRGSGSSSSSNNKLSMDIVGGFFLFGLLPWLRLPMVWSSVCVDVLYWSERRASPRE